MAYKERIVEKCRIQKLGIRCQQLKLVKEV